MTNRLLATLFALLAMGVLTNCTPDDDDGDSSSDAGADANDGTSGHDGYDSSASPDWLSAFDAEAGSSSCSVTFAEAAALPQITSEGTTLAVGYAQVSSDNQNPLVMRVDDGEPTWCIQHEDDGPDARALGITWDGGDFAYVVYTVVGGGTDLEGQGGWLGSYAPGAIHGGGPKVSYLGRVAVADGSLAGGTFIIAVLSSNGVNTHRPSGPVAVLEDGTVEFYGDSAHKPIDTTGNASMDCTDYPFNSRYRFSADLTTVVCADCSNCTSSQPCD